MNIKQKVKHIFQLVFFVLLYIVWVMQKSQTARKKIQKFTTTLHPKIPNTPKQTSSTCNHPECSYIMHYIHFCNNTKNIRWTSSGTDIVHFDRQASTFLKNYYLPQDHGHITQYKKQFILTVTIWHNNNNRPTDLK